MDASSVAVLFSLLYSVNALQPRAVEPSAPYQPVYYTKESSQTSPASLSSISSSVVHDSTKPSSVPSNNPAAHFSHTLTHPSYSQFSQSADPSSYLSQFSTNPSSDLSQFSAASHQPSISSYHINQQFPTVNQHFPVNQQYPTVGLQEYTVQASAQVPYTAQQNLYHQGITPYQQNNQNRVNQAFQIKNQQPYENLYIPFNQYQNVNSDLTKNIHIPSKVLSQSTQNAPQVFIQHQTGQKHQHQQVVQNNQPQQVGQKVGTVKSPPLFQHQVYHPLHTVIHHENQQIHPQYQQQNQRTPLQQKQRVPLQQKPRAPLQQTPRLSPPTPPRIYKNFRPMIPNKPIQAISSPKPQKEETPHKEEEKEEANEDESNEKLEEDDEEDHRNIQQENEEADDEEENLRMDKFFTEKFRQDHDDQQDHEDQENDRSEEDYEDHRNHRNHRRYRQRDHQEADDDEEDKYSESPRKSSSKDNPKIVDKHSYYKNKYFGKPFKDDSDFESFRGFKEPKVEIKMYKYSKSMKPDRREYIEGKESENIPVVQHDKKTYKSQWIVSTKTSSLSDE